MVRFVAGIEHTRIKYFYKNVTYIYQNISIFHFHTFCIFSQTVTCQLSNTET